MTERQRDLERYQRALDEMPASVSIYDADRRFGFVNDSLASAYDTTPDELVGTESPILQQLRTERDDDPFAELVAGDRELFADTVVLDISDREEAIIDYELTRLETDGEFDGVLGVFRDVTDERRREERLERTTARLNALFENSPDMIDIHDRDGTIVDANRSMCEELGYDADELVGMSVWDVDVEMDPEAGKRVWNALDVDETSRVETTYRRRDGSTFPAQVHIRRIDVQGADRFLVSSRDVSEQKAYERQIERENERLDEFASIVSHDLRNPLNVADGRLKLAREECDSEHLEHAERALARMDGLIEDLLTLAREGETADDPEPVDLAATVDGCWVNVETADATLVIDVNRTIHADESRLKQLVENLVRNAVEHGGDTVTVTVGELDDGFYVEDDGPGIPESERDDVFDAGYSTNEAGTGFGLSIVKQVVNAHDWKIRVTEGSKGGARFEVSGVTFSAD